MSALAFKKANESHASFVYLVVGGWCLVINGGSGSAVINGGLWLVARQRSLCNHQWWPGSAVINGALSLVASGGLQAFVYYLGMVHCRRVVGIDPSVLKLRQDVTYSETSAWANMARSQK